MNLELQLPVIDLRLTDRDMLVLAGILGMGLLCVWAVVRR